VKDNIDTASAASRATLAAPRAWWASLAARERTLLGVGAWALGLLLVWLLALQPAWRTLSRAPTELDALDAQLQVMQRQAQESQTLRVAAPVSPDQASAALTAATARLGDKAKLSVQGERATLTLTGVSTTALRDWLAEARAGARARPIEANLTRAATGFSGTLVLGLGGVN
jgi:general secretion pathway protein M